MILTSVPAPVYTLSQLRIGAFNALELASITAPSTADGFDVYNLVDGRPGTYWKPATAALSYDIDFALAEAAWVDYAGLYSGDLAALGCSVEFFYSHDGITYTRLGAFSPGETAPMYITFDAVFASRFRMTVHANMQRPSIGVVSMGKEFRPEHGVCVGFTPPTLGGQPIVLTNNSMAASWLGVSFRSRVPYEGSLQLDLINPERARLEWKPLLNRLIRAPFFLKWHGTAYPYEIAYCWLDGSSPTVENQKVNFMTTTLKYVGLIS